MIGLVNPSLRTGGVLLAVWLIGCLQTLSQPFTNGDFEVPSVMPVFRGLNPGDAWFPGWTAGGAAGDIVLVNGPFDSISPFSGNQWVLFTPGNSPARGSLMQEFSTTPGQGYTVTLELAQSVSGASYVQLTAEVIDDNSSLLATNSFAPLSQAWTQFSFVFAATTSNTTLILKDTSPQTDGVDLGLDTVTLGTNSDKPIVLLGGPASLTAKSGATSVFNVLFSGGNVDIQWFLATAAGTNPISGATNSTLDVIAGYNTAGRYFAELSNVISFATSQQAVLTVPDLCLTFRLQTETSRSRP